MSLSQKKRLLALNHDFYEKTAVAFSWSRQHFWPGWQQLLFPPVDKLQVLDVAAGNLRFHKFLRTKFTVFQYLGIDGSLKLLQESGCDPAIYQKIDLLQALIDHHDFTQALRPQNFNYIFCSAFFHHIPGDDWRRQLLQQLYDLLLPGGYLTVTFWQFLSDASFAKQIEQNLGDNDYLLGWHAGVNATRYVHNFTDLEITALSQFLTNQGAKIVASYSADGRTGKMNRYLIWQKPLI